MTEDIEKEHNLLILGKNPLVSDLDDHKKHVEAHMELLNDTNHKTNPDTVKAVIDHCTDHIGSLYEAISKNVNAFGVKSVITQK